MTLMAQFWNINRKLEMTPQAWRADLAVVIIGADIC